MSTEPHFIPVFVDVKAQALVMSTGLDASTFVITERANKPSPWLQLKEQLDPEHGLKRFRKHLAGLPQAELTRVLVRLHHFFHYDRISVNDYLDQEDPIGTFLAQDQLAVYAYYFAPGESNHGPYSVEHPMWTNALRYQQATKASDDYWKHRLAFQLGRSVQDNWRQVNPKTLDGSQELTEHSASLARSP